jgi:AcrR family transcriptional regulator
MDAIAAVAWVSQQTIYNHFGDKEALFRAVQSAFAGDFHATGLKVRPTPSDDVGRDLRELGRRWLAVVLRKMPHRCAT